MMPQLILWASVLLLPQPVIDIARCDQMITVAPVPYYIKRGDIVTATSVEVMQCMPPHEPRKGRKRRR